MTERVALYPGTFDPITNGHMDIIRRGSKVVDRLVVGVAINAGKNPMFAIDERVQMVRQEIATYADNGRTKVEVRPFKGLLIHFAMEVGAQFILRGLRAVSDFDYEFQMVGMNARMNSDIETIFLMASERHHFIASRLVKEIAELGGDISSFVSPEVAGRLLAQVGRGQWTGTDDS